MTCAPLHKLNILVVDDEELVLGTICLCLERDGHHVQGATDGTEALALFRPDRFDLVITDLDMPGIKGDELAGAIKAVAPTQPVIMITARIEVMSADQDRLKNIDWLLDKPFGVESLRAAIASVVSRKHHS